MVPFTKYETISRVCFKATLRVGVSSSSQSDPIRRYSPAPCSHPNMVTSGSEKSTIEMAILPNLRLQNSSCSFIIVNCVEINRKCGAREGLERVEKAH